MADDTTLPGTGDVMRTKERPAGHKDQGVLTLPVTMTFTPNVATASVNVDTVIDLKADEFEGAKALLVQARMVGGNANLARMNVSVKRTVGASSVQGGCSGWLIAGGRLIPWVAESLHWFLLGSNSPIWTQMVEGIVIADLDGADTVTLGLNPDAATGATATLRVTGIFDDLTAQHAEAWRTRVWEVNDDWVVPTDSSTTPGGQFVTPYKAIGNGQEEFGLSPYLPLLIEIEHVAVRDYDGILGSDAILWIGRQEWDATGNVEIGYPVDDLLYSAYADVVPIPLGAPVNTGGDYKLYVVSIPGGIPISTLQAAGFYADYGMWAAISSATSVTFDGTEGYLDMWLRGRQTPQRKGY